MEVLSCLIGKSKKPLPLYLQFISNSISCLVWDSLYISHRLSALDSVYNSLKGLLCPLREETEKTASSF